MINSTTVQRPVLVLALGGCAAMAVLAGGCSADAATGGTPSGDPAPVVVRDGAGGHTVTVTAGQRLEVILAGSYWDVAGSSQPSVLRQDGTTVLLARPDACPTIPGAGCTPIRIDFSALKPGIAVVTASRMGCGEGLVCAPSQRNFTLTVTVRPEE